MRLFRTAALLALTLTAPVAMAQEDQSPHWHVATANPDLLLAVDVHGAVEKGDQIRRTQAAIYFPKTDSTAEGPMDFSVMVNDFDCGSPGRYRIVSAESYTANVKDAIATVDQPREWKTSQPNSSVYDAWQAVCVGPEPKSALLGFSTHEAILTKYRQMSASME